MSRDLEFQILDGKSLSLKDLKRYTHDRTAHAGAYSRTSQLMILEAEATILAYTGNTEGDPTYKPATVDSINVKADDRNANRLTPFTPVNKRVTDQLAVDYGVGNLRRANSLAQLHQEAARAVWGRQSIPFHHFFTSTDEGRAVIKALAQVPGACDRVLNPTGALEYVDKPKSVEPDHLLTTLTSIGDSAVPERPVNIKPGPYLSNESNVALHMLTRALQLRDHANGHGVRIIHSSGPDMYRYALKEKFALEATRITLEAAQRLGLKSGRMEMVLFPAAGYVVSNPHTPETVKTFEHISELMDLLLAFQGDGEKRHQSIIDVAKKYKTEVDTNGRVVTAGKDRMIELTSLLANEMRKLGLNFKPREWTQWDILKTGNKPITPEVFTRLPAQQVFHLMEILKSVHNKGSRVSVNRRLPSDIFS